MILENLWVILPEIILLVMACVCLLIETRFIVYLLSQAALIMTALACYRFFSFDKATLLYGQFIADPFSQGVKFFILILMFFTLLYSRSYVRERNIAHNEYHVLALFTTLGMMCLVSAKSLLMIYLGLELFSLPLYALVTLQRDSKLSVEAGMKYFIMGALASGLLLYGISLLYGVSQSIELDQIAHFIDTVSDESSRYIVVFGMIFMLVGVVFKLGGVPFHMWVPDVYQGAPTHITLLVSTAPKVAAFGMAYRLLHDAFPGPIAVVWSHFFILLAILSLIIGNIVALVQTNIKRLFAYSAIAHIGFLLLSLLVAPLVGYAPALYYIGTYTITALAAFGVLLLLSQQGMEIQTFSDLKGLAQRNPWIAFLMLLVVFSMAGIPPMVGFYAKFIVLGAYVKQCALLWRLPLILVNEQMGHGVRPAMKLIYSNAFIVAFVKNLVLSILLLKRIFQIMPF